MTNNARADHITRGFSLKCGQVTKAIKKNCAFVWVEYGKTFRDATPAEAMKMRNEIVKSAEPLEFAEIPGLIFQHSGHEEDVRRELRIAMEANRLCPSRKESKRNAA